jgi:hypothetical protein
MLGDTELNAKWARRVGVTALIVIICVGVSLGFAALFGSMKSGPYWFGVVIGYVTYRTLKHKKDAGISDIAAVIGAIGGATIVGLFPVVEGRFDQYAIGLAYGFFFFIVVFWVLAALYGPEGATQQLDDD